MAMAMAMAMATATSLHLPSKINQEGGGGGGAAAVTVPVTDLKSSSFISPLPLRKIIIPSSRKQKLSMRLVASKQSYICRDCGYIYSDRTPFEKLADKYFCPVCGAPKRRFRAYEQSLTKNANEFDVRKARKAQIQKDEAIGKVLPIAAAVGVLALVGLYLYLNSVF